MADIEKVIKALEHCTYEGNCTECIYYDRAEGAINCPVDNDALALLKEQQAEIERLCKKIGVMKESIEDAIMSETVFDTFDDLSSYVNAERCRSEDWTGGIRDAIQAVRAWGE